MFLRARRGIDAFLRTLLVVATFMLARIFHETLSPHGLLYLVTAWVLGCAALSSVTLKGSRPAGSR